jgi:hypothetical protein
MCLDTIHTASRITSEFSKESHKIPCSRLEQTPIIDKLDNTNEEFAIALAIRPLLLNDYNNSISPYAFTVKNIDIHFY